MPDSEDLAQHGFGAGVTFHHTVSYADTDAGGIVYHGRFLDMAERSRNKLLNEAGFTFAKLATLYGQMLVVRKVEIVYVAPAVLEDRLVLESWLDACGPSRTCWTTKVMRGTTHLACIRLEFVAVDMATREIRRHPAALLECLKPYVKEL